MNKTFKLIALIALFSVGTFFAKEKNNAVPVSAATGEKPTGIDVTDMDDSELSGFYSGVEGKKGSELLAFLNGKIKNHLEYNYESDSHREIYKIIERDWNIDSPSSGTLAGFNYKDDNGYLRLLYGDYNGDIDTAARFYKEDSTTSVTFDKEHIWPQSLGGFGRIGGAGSDFHALWAADPLINRNAHSNNHYAVPTLEIKERPTSYGTNGGRTGRLTVGGDLVFEPKDEYKGDIARAMFYMPARYFDYEDVLHPKLELVNGTPLPVTGSASVSGKAGDLATLLEWNELDPVDEFEIHRNNLIYNNYQLNRNPFIDYPQWARIAYDSSYSGTGASNLLESSSVGNDSDPFKDATLLSISVDYSNVKKDYLKGEKFKTQGLLVTANYDNGQSVNLKNYSISVANNEVLSTPGDIQVEVSYTHGDNTFSDSFIITVVNQTLSDVLFISEVYGGGGNSGAPFTHDFIEIYNHSENIISLAGKSIQQAPANSATWKSYALTGDIQAKSYYLIQLATEKDPIGVELPLSDFSGSAAVAVSGFKVALVNSTGKLTGVDDSTNTDLIDFIGAGSSANYYYGAKASVPTDNKKSVTRKFTNGIPSKENNNSVDYITANPSPTNSAISIGINIMAIGDTTGQCYIQYPIFKQKVLSLTDSIYDQDTNEVISYGQRFYFENGSDSRLAVGRQRYETWAMILGDHTPYLPDSEVLEPTNNFINNNNNTAIYVLMASLLITFSAYFVIRKKKTN